MSVVLQKDETKADLARFHHAALFLPVNSTLISALHNNYLTTWPGLDKQLINRHLEKILHLDQDSEWLQSTKVITPPSSNDADILKRWKDIIKRKKLGQSLKEVLQLEVMEDSFPELPTLNIKENQIMYHIYEPQLKGTAYTYLTGRFLFRSRRGYEYILVGYHFDVNAFLATPLKNR